MLPGNGGIIRGTRDFVPYSSDEDVPDTIDNHIKMLSRGSETAQNTRDGDFRSQPPASPHHLDQADLNKQGQEDLDSLTKTRNESRAGSSDSDHPASLHTQGALVEPMDTMATSTGISFTLNNTPLPDHHPVKYLDVARRDYVGSQPPFVRVNKKEAPKLLILADANGQLSHPELQVNLVTRTWDRKSSFYTIDRSGERLIVKPMGPKYSLGDRIGSQYRTWSGQGNAYDGTPVAYLIHDDAQELPTHGKHTEDALKSKRDDISVENSDFLGNGGTRVAVDAPRAKSAPASPRRFASPHASLAESSNAARKDSETAAGKRSASDYPVNDQVSKRLRPGHVNPLTNITAVAKVPASLTEYKQERTILFVPLRGSKSDMVPIKLSSAMTIPRFFSSVCAAAGIAEDEDRVISIMLEPWDNGLERSIILRRDTLQAFEYLLETIDESDCWNEEGGRLSLWLKLRW